MAWRGACLAFSVSVIWSMRSERRRDDGDFQGTACERLKGGAQPEDLLGDAGLMKGQARIDGMDDKIIPCPAGDLQGKPAENGFARPVALRRIQVFTCRLSETRMGRGRYTEFTTPPARKHDAPPGTTVL